MRWSQTLLVLVVVAAVAVGAGAATLEVVPAASEARYLVREQLAGLSFPNDAVGTTQRVSGTIALDGEGRPAPGSKFTVDLRSLRSDEERRDNYLRERTLTTASFPYAEFVPREIRGLPFPLPGAGRATVQLLGDLTIRGVTRPTTWEGTVEFRGSTIRLQARTAFTFADFALTQPRVMRVLSIEDKIRLEVDLTLRPAS
jgi:polyisoprenoid-binding protein YceI